MTDSRTAGEESVQGESGVDPRSWVEAHGDALFRYAMVRLRDRDAAEEVVQECFLGALGAQQRFQEQSSERTWLIGILKHKIVDRIRSRKKSEQVPQEGKDEFFDKKGLWREGPRRWSQDPTASAQRKEFWVVLRDCLDKLPAALREAFLLRELDQMESDDLTEVLSISAPTLWQHLHRARLRLRKCLELNWFKPPKTRKKVCG